MDLQAPLHSCLGLKEHPGQWSLQRVPPDVVYLTKRTKKIDFASMPCCSPKVVCLREPRSHSHNVQDMPHFCHKLSVRGEVISLYSISAKVFTAPLQFTVVCSWGLAATLILFWVLVFIVHRLWSCSPMDSSFIVPWTLCL